jgi:peptidylprolyl isomerase
VFTLLLLTGAAFAAEWPVDPVDAPWTTSALGVEIQDLVVGGGDVVVMGASVAVHYRGLLADGTEFDASRARGRPLTLRIGAGEVIPGWEDGLLGMAVGGTRRMVIPPDLGYGSRPVGPIPANSVLYFEVELVSLTPPRSAPASPDTVAEESWQEVKGGRYADLVSGTGARTRKNHRVCVDYAVFRGLELVEDTYARGRCTWFGPLDDDLPTELWAGLTGMREGGQRQIVGPDGTVYQVELSATHN